MSRALLVLLAAGCGVRVEGPSGDCPCAADFSDHPRSAELQAVLDERVARGLPGLSVAVRTPDGVWAGAAGFADLERGVQMTPCHVHHLASVAKTYHAALALELQSRGELDLDDRVASILPADVLDGIPNADRVTLRQLMNHTSGIPDFNALVSYVVSELNDPTEENDPDDLLDVVRGMEPLARPGAEYSYADTNYVLLALALDAVTGDVAGAIGDEVLGPLGLADTTVYVRGEPEPACLCDTYWEIGGDRLENVSDLSLEYATQDIGADGVAATPLDALAFVEGLVRGDLLTPDALGEMRDWTTASARDDGYGYGLGLARTEPATGEMDGHTGGGVGTGAVMRASPDRDLTFVAATNVGLFLGGPASAAFDETLWDDLAAAAGIGAE